MVKKMISRLSALTLLIVCLVACSKQAEYTYVIPADATTVVSIDLKALFEKSGLKDKENEALKEKMLNSFKSEMTASTYQQFEKIMKDPQESGIDVTEPVYVFMSTRFSSPTLVAKVNDENRLHASLEILEKEKISKAPVSEADGYSYIQIDKSFFAFNKSVAILCQLDYNLTLEEAQKSIAALMKQNQKNSIGSKGFFKKIGDGKGDINFYAKAEAALPKKLSGQLTWGLSSKIKPEDLNFLGYLTFEKGQITLGGEYYTENEEVKKLLKEQEKVFKKIEGNFMSYFPNSTLGFFNLAINGEGLYNMLKENKEFRQSFSVAKAAEVEKLFQAFDGDLSIGVINVSLDKMPTFAAYAKVKDNNVLQELYKRKNELGLSKRDQLLQLDKNKYVLKSGSNHLFFGIKEQTFYATNDDLIYKNIATATTNSLKEGPYFSEMKGKMCFSVLNISELLELPMVKMLVALGGEEMKMYSDATTNASALTLSSDNEQMEMKLVLKDQKTNALKQIVDFAKKFIKL
ncbi:MAG: DUF4836 family protein [Bacteroidia bacterium]|nr:DUF4836 family protein [Bacteroidia bacterium]